MAITINANNYNNYTEYNQRKLMQKLSSGKRINTAADDAAGLAISEKLLESITKENQEIENYQDEQSMLRVSDGMYEGTSDYLMDMYEQGVRAQNSLLSDSDREVINDYMETLKKDAAAMLDTTKFNEMKVASNDVKEALPQDFSLESIESAINSVNSQRSQDGARYNGLQHAVNEKAVAAENLTASRSRILDTEYGSTVSDLQKNRTLETYRNMMQARQMRESQERVTNLF